MLDLYKKALKIEMKIHRKIRNTTDIVSLLHCYFVYFVTSTVPSAQVATEPL